MTLGGYSFAVTCPRCGSSLDHVADGRVIAGTETSVIARCPTCPSWLGEWHISVWMRPLLEFHGEGGDFGPARCGTESGYSKHRRVGEQPCGDCRRAHNEAEKERQRLQRRRLRQQRVGVFT